jgi:hypothetical protein
MSHTASLTPFFEITSISSKIANEFANSTISKGSEIKLSSIITLFKFLSSSNVSSCLKAEKHIRYHLNVISSIL